MPDIDSIAIPAFDTNRQILTPARVPVAALSECFERAAARGYREFQLRVAGFPVRIRVAGAAWADMVAAWMGHLRYDGSQCEPVLTVDVWDVHETGVAAPQRVNQDSAAPPNLMRTTADGLFVGEGRPHGMAWLDRTHDRIVGFTLGVARLNLDERARPFHKMLSAWLGDRGVQFIHSGMITLCDKGILFVGNVAPANPPRQSRAWAPARDPWVTISSASV